VYQQLIILAVAIYRHELCWLEGFLTAWCEVAGVDCSPFSRFSGGLSGKGKEKNIRYFSKAAYGSSYPWLDGACAGLFDPSTLLIILICLFLDYLLVR
jgi:hypothetical protein